MSETPNCLIPFKTFTDVTEAVLLTLPIRIGENQ